MAILCTVVDNAVDKLSCAAIPLLQQVHHWEQLHLAHALEYRQAAFQVRLYDSEQS
jgi:hypothetical protein